MTSNSTSGYGDEPRISLVVATLGRSEALLPLLKSLDEQQYKNFELIIVDQNLDNRLDAILAPYQSMLEIRHIRTPIPGLNRSRNLGGADARGDWILFPDDDCWYPQDYLMKMRSLIVSGKADIYCGRAVNPEGNANMGNFADHDMMVDRMAVWKTMIEWTTLFRMSVFREVGGFDEKLGVGSGTPWGANEGPDLVLRCLLKGAKASYHVDLIAFHPDHVVEQGTAANRRKMYSYNCGFGYVLRKHGYGFDFILPYLIRPVGGMAYYTLRGRFSMAARSWSIFKGRFYGWNSSEAKALRSQFSPKLNSNA